MKTLLFLVHRIPYPPNKGDKIRSYQLLKHLGARFRVLLGAFVDYADDWRHRADVEAMCAEAFLRPLHPLAARARSSVGLLRRQPLTVPYYRDWQMAEWARAKAAEGVDAVLVFSSSMAQYVQPSAGGSPVQMIDFVDLDSEKWRQYGASRRGVAGAIYRREARLLAEYEDRVARRFDYSSFVSAAEAQTLLDRCPDVAAKVYPVANGVDHERFDPAASTENPYGPGEQTVVFTGAMDYWANIDAVQWFAREIWPKVAERVPAARFYIVGSNPAASVWELARIPGVRVTGTVDDVRPYLKFARVAVAPMRIARGVQNKVLEAMAMGLPVIGTGAAAEGLSDRVTECMRVEDDAEAFGRAVIDEMGGTDRAAVAARNRAAVTADYDWSTNLAIVADLLDGRPGARAV